MDIANLGLSVSSDGFVRADAAMSKFNRTASRTEQQAQKISTQTEGMARSFRRAAGYVGMMATAFAAVGFAALTRSVFANTEAFKQLNNQLRQVAESEEQLSTVRQGLFAISRQTNTAIESTVSLYTDLYRSTRDLGTSQQEVADVTRTINNLFLAGGKSAAETAGAIRQLSQGLASGALRGDEFNSVSEGAPRIMDALAESLKMTRGELREFAATGGITSKIMVDALKDYSVEAQRLADMTDKTFGQRMTNARNNMVEFAGTLNTAAGIIGDAGRIIENFTASLASGQAMKNIQSFVVGFQQAASDIMAAIDVVSTYAGNAAGQVSFDWGKALLDIPANLTAVAQLMGAAWAHIISYANLTAKTVGDAFIAQFSVIKNVAELTGQAIVAGLNPLDKGPSADDWAAAITDPFKTVVDEFKAQSEILNSSWDDTRDSIFKARDDAIKASDDMRKQGDELRKAWEANRGVFDDVAAGITSTGTSADLTYDQIMALNSGLDKLLGGDLFAFVDVVKEVDQAVQGMTMADKFAAVADGIGQMQGALQNGSKEAKKLGVVLQGLAVAQGVLAVLNQGQGDPYTAFARMAAMAAAVASLGVQVGNMSSGGADQTASNRQAAQGSGTVFGDNAAKSESAINSLEMQVRLTEDLVGINRGMLDALQAMQAGIAGAVGGIIRGGGLGIDVNTGTTNLLGDTLFTELEGLWGKSGLKDLFRNTRRLVDSGISILGGAFGEILSGSVDFAVAFAEIEKKKKIFGITVSESTNQQTQALTDETNRAFGQIITAMSDAVFSAAEALGFGEEEIRRRIADYELAATQISLKDLDAEEQQEQLNAVFSSIFDGLAADVVPFVTQFSQIGEGYAETLIRVASQVQVAKEAVSQLGLSILDGLGPEEVARVSDELTNAAGGLDAFVSSLQSFVSRFASDEQQLAIATDQVTRAFGQLGQDLPATRDGLWSLMQTLTDPNDIAAVLSLTDALDEYYSALEEIDNERQGLTIALLRAQGNEEAALNLERQQSLLSLNESNRALQEQIWALLDQAAAAEEAAQAQQALSDFQRGIADQILDIVSPAHAELERLNQAMAAQIAQAEALGIAEDDLTNMRRLHQLQLMEFAAGLEESIKSLSDQLFGGEIESQVQKTVSAVDNGMNRIRESMISAIKSVQDWLLSSQLSAVSPLTPGERLGEAERQFNTQFAAAMGGDVDAINALPKLADQLLSEASTFFGGSTAEFDQIWMQVRDAMQQVTGIDVPDERQTQAAIKQATESAALSAFEQIGIASDILSQVAAYSRITEESPAEIARRLDVPFGDLLSILGETPERTAGALDAQFNELVTGFDMTIDPLLSVQQAQLEATYKQTEDQNERLERIEMLLERGVQYDAVTANNTAHTAVSQEQLAAEARKQRNAGSPQQRIQ